MERSKELKRKVIAGLQKEREELSEYSAFGDPNHKIIDYQIRAIQGEFQNDQEIWNLKDEDEELGDMAIGEIIDAYEWALGEENNFEEYYL